MVSKLNPASLICFIAVAIVLAIGYLYPRTTHLKDAIVKQPFHHKNNGSRSTKVFVFAYMRGGSTIIGELFNQDPDSIMWYEPGFAFFSHYHGVNVNIPRWDLFTSSSGGDKMRDIFEDSYTKRFISPHEKQSMVEYYQNLLNCRLEDTPVETLGHGFIRRSSALQAYMQCMGTPFQSVIEKCWQSIRKVCKQMPVALYNNCSQLVLTTQKMMKNVDLTNINADLLIHNITVALRGMPNITSQYVPSFVDREQCLESRRKDVGKCLSKAKQICDSRPINVVQVIRMTMDMMEDLVLAEPDIKVIYYTRDPRGLALSRSYTGKNKTYVENVMKVRCKFLCYRMANDQRYFKLLQRKYQDSFLQVKYEDYVMNPLVTAKHIYAFLGRSLPVNISDFFEEHMYSNQGADHTQGTYVQNATQTATKWKWVVSEETIKKIQQFCGDYLRDRGYPII